MKITFLLKKMIVGNFKYKRLQTVKLWSIQHSNLVLRISVTFQLSVYLCWNSINLHWTFCGCGQFEFKLINWPMCSVRWDSYSHDKAHQSILPWWCTERLWGWRKGCYQSLWCQSWVLSNTPCTRCHWDTFLQETLYHMDNHHPVLLNTHANRQKQLLQAKEVQ